MREGIHPRYFPQATVVCACGNTWKTGSTIENISTDVCSDCHPFYTGEQRIVDTEGQVDRFYKKLQARQEYLEAEAGREADKVSPNLELSSLELAPRILTILEKAEIVVVGDVLAKLASGDDEMLAVEGFGRKSLADLKRALKRRGYELPQSED